MTRPHAIERWATGRPARVLRGTARRRVIEAGWAGRSVPEDWLLPPSMRRAQRRQFAAYFLAIPAALTAPMALFTLSWLERFGLLPPDITAVRSILGALVVVSLAGICVAMITPFALGHRLRRRWERLILRERGVDACTRCPFIGAADPHDVTHCPECGHENPAAPSRSAESRRRRTVYRAGLAIVFRNLEVPGLEGAEADAVRDEARVRTTHALSPARSGAPAPRDTPEHLDPRRVRRRQHAIFASGTLPLLAIGAWSVLRESDGMIPAWVIIIALVAVLASWTGAALYTRRVARAWITVLATEP